MHTIPVKDSRFAISFAADTGLVRLVLLPLLSILLIGLAANLLLSGLVLSLVILLVSGILALIILAVLSS